MKQIAKTDEADSIEALRVDPKWIAPRGRFLDTLTNEIVREYTERAARTIVADALVGM